VGFKVVWTPLARDDLREIVTYIARDNPEAALRVGEGILGSVEPLGAMPGMGRMVPERRDERIREIVRGNYRIVYRVREDSRTVEIWRVWHGARGTPQLPKSG
jgi:plasmid stabilization system protein ParE